jgi:DNA-directed RNA polymerase specialized sigma24 family protein
LVARDLRRERNEREETSPYRTEPPTEGDEVMDALRKLLPIQRAANVLHDYVDLPVRELKRSRGERKRQIGEEAGAQPAPSMVRVRLAR